MKITLAPVAFLVALTISILCDGQAAHDSDSVAQVHLGEVPALGNRVSAMDKKIVVIFQASNHTYWFGSDAQGVYKFDGKTLAHFSTKDGLCGNRIRGIQEDDAGNIYFDTRKGVSKFDGRRFSTLPLANEQSNQGWKSEPTDLWFEGNWGGSGPLRYDGELLHPLTFPKHELEDAFRSNNPNASFSPYEVYKIFRDSKGNLWFGTAMFGACRFDGESFSWISETELIEFEGGRAPGVRSILEDKDGAFWFSANVNHKYRVDDVSEKAPLNYEQRQGIPIDQQADVNPYFMAILQDDKEDIWMATYDSGVWRYDGKKLIHYPVRIGNKNVSIFTIYRDKLGDIWLGTHNAGALKLNGNIFEVFEPKL